MTRSDHSSVNDRAIDSTTLKSHQAHLRMPLANDHVTTQKVGQKSREKVDGQGNPTDGWNKQKSPIQTETTPDKEIERDRINPGTAHLMTIEKTTVLIYDNQKSRGM